MSKLLGILKKPALLIGLGVVAVAAGAWWAREHGYIGLVSAIRGLYKSEVGRDPGPLDDGVLDWAAQVKKGRFTLATARAAMRTTPEAIAYRARAA